MLVQLLLVVGELLLVIGACLDGALPLKRELQVLDSITLFCLHTFLGDLCAVHLAL